VLHMKALIRAMAGAFAVSSVQNGHAQTATVGLLKLCESRRQRAQAHRRGVEKTGQRECGNGDEASAAEHSLTSSLHEGRDVSTRTNPPRNRVGNRIDCFQPQIKREYLRRLSPCRLNPRPARLDVDRKKLCLSGNSRRCFRLRRVPRAKQDRRL
jgi:hypothetical protein